LYCTLTWGVGTMIKGEKKPMKTSRLAKRFPREVGGVTRGGRRGSPPELVPL